MVQEEHQEAEIEYQEEFIKNSRGMQQFTCRWLPKHRQPKSLVFLCHGFAGECSISMEGTGRRLAAAGYAVHGIDYEGHGKSEGLRGYFPSFNRLVDDCLAFFTSVSEREENRGKKQYLLGESMGGAVALCLHRKAPPAFWDGAVLVAPMCKIADDMKPSPIVIGVLKMLINVIPTWPIVPTPDGGELSFKSPEVRQRFRSNKYCYHGKPRLRTAFELLTVSEQIEKTLHKVTVPFLIVHGGDDRVTDPAVSKLLYDSAASTDKTFKLYPGMWHALTSGEPPENIDLVLGDMVSWLDTRTAID